MKFSRSKSSCEEFLLRQKIAAYMVHLFTALGMVVGFFAIIAIAKNEFLKAFFFLQAALLIDGIDGTLARYFKVEDILPHMNGSIMDDVIDFANDVVIPSFFLYTCGRWDGESYNYLFPQNYRWIVITIILVVSALYYAKTEMISSEMYFNGFPALWNIVTFYLFFIFSFSQICNFLIVIIVAIAHFLPLKFPYVSRGRYFLVFNVSTVVLFAVSNTALLLLWRVGQDSLWLKVLSVGSISCFLCEAIYISFLDRKKRPGLNG